MCIEPPRPCDTPASRPNSSAMTLLRVRAARQRVAVRAVGRDQVVLVAHRADGADDRRLLADREVQEAADLRLRVHLARALLEAADEHHRLQPLARGVGLRQLALRGRRLLLPHVGHRRGTLPGRRVGRAHALLVRRLLRAALGGMGAAQPPGGLARVVAARPRRVGAGSATARCARARTAPPGCSASCRCRRGSPRSRRARGRGRCGLRRDDAPRRGARRTAAGRVTIELRARGASRAPVATAYGPVIALDAPAAGAGGGACGGAGPGRTGRMTDDERARAGRPHPRGRLPRPAGSTRRPSERASRSPRRARGLGAAGAAPRAARGDRGVGGGESGGRVGSKRNEIEHRCDRRASRPATVEAF